MKIIIILFLVEFSESFVRQISDDNFDYSCNPIRNPIDEFCG